jgi:hypothetical protein
MNGFCWCTMQVFLYIFLDLIHRTWQGKAVFFIYVHSKSKVCTNKATVNPQSWPIALQQGFNYGFVLVFVRFILANVFYILLACMCWTLYWSQSGVYVVRYVLMLNFCNFHTYSRNINFFFAKKLQKILGLKNIITQF